MSHPAFVRVALAALVVVPALGGAACNKKSDDARPAAGSGSAAPAAAAPQDKPTIKIGMVASFSGPFADISKQLMGGIKTYMKQHGDTVAGKKIELLTRDTTGPLPEVAKRLAQELVVQDKVDFLTGFGLTPEALGAASVATEGKTPMVIMNAATSIITTKSPYIVRFSLTLPQVCAPLGDWAAKNGIKKVVTMVSDYGPGHDAEAAFTKAFTAGGGQVIDAIQTPVQNPDFSSFIQRVKDKHPDAVFVFVPAGQQSIAAMKAYDERGLAKAGIKLIATGDVLDDHNLATIGDPALGAISSYHYSVAHDSPENKAFLEAYRDANGADAGLPNFMSVAAYDAMSAIYDVITKLDGKIDPDKAMDILKHEAFTSPRGPISIDPETRDIVQTVYLRKVEKVNGELRSVEIQPLVTNMKDPGKDAGK
ncbi:MAG TPA: ABC transporter substrate-binding protein [Kofleriaceae bacterium]|jgi:branched-chain amino acid transport system substrate-binding protein|nr:ABC transporter substrate-binding protein [Kofleriaceae bacterium]